MSAGANADILRSAYKVRGAQATRLTDDLGIEPRPQYYQSCFGRPRVTDSPCPLRKRPLRGRRYADGRLAPWHAEVVDLHDFFQGWLDGTLPATDAAYARLPANQAPAFIIITPGGEIIPGPLLVAQLRAAHGSRPGWRMWIEWAALRHAHGDLSVVTYEEWHRRADGVVTARLSTAIFQAQPAAPNGLVWLHVHETWLPGQAPPEA